jgi:predicted transcriptional regulator
MTEQNNNIMDYIVDNKTASSLLGNPLSVRDIQITKFLIRNKKADVNEVALFLAKRLNEDVLYTTALKLLQIMHKKGHVKREIDGKKHIYTSVYNMDDLLFYIKVI